MKQTPVPFRLSIFHFFRIVVLAAMFPLLGCQPQTASNSAASESPSRSDPCWGYQAADIRIVGLTGFAEDRSSRLEVVVELLDAFGSRIKSPVVFRIELYEYQPRSNDPKGQRIAAWPDIDLTKPSDNNAAWRDFLRAYRFDLPLETRPVASADFVLEVTARTPAGKRLVAQTRIAPVK
jgi:hypothetical protein